MILWISLAAFYLVTLFLSLALLAGCAELNERADRQTEILISRLRLAEAQNYREAA